MKSPLRRCSAVPNALGDAAARRITLTEHAIAISRAGAAVKRLDAFIENLGVSGAPRACTKEYKRRRLAARERGEGFMSFGTAEARLRAVLIPLLTGGKPVVGDRCSRGCSVLGDRGPPPILTPPAAGGYGHRPACLPASRSWPK